VPAISVGIIRQDQRQLGNLTGERVNLGTRNMIHQQFVALLITPVMGQSIAHLPKCRTQEDASAGKRLVHLRWRGAELPEPEAIEDIIGNMPWRAVGSELGPCLRCD